MHGEPRRDMEAANARSQPPEHGMRKLFVATISIVLLAAVAVTLRSSAVSGSRPYSADELLAAAVSHTAVLHTHAQKSEPKRPHVFNSVDEQAQLSHISQEDEKKVESFEHHIEALRGKESEPKRPHVFNSVDEQAQLSHISQEDEKKVESFEHHIEALRAQVKQHTLQHEHEVTVEENEMKPLQALTPKRPAVFDSESEEAQQERADASAQKHEKSLLGAEKNYAKLSKNQEVHHEERLDKQILREQTKEAMLLKRDDVDKGSVYTSKQAEETQAEGAEAAKKSEEAWQHRVDAYRQQAAQSTAKFESSVHELAQRSAARAAKDAAGTVRAAVYTSQQAEETQAEGEQDAEERERAWRQRVQHYRQEAASSAAAFRDAVHELAEKASARQSKAEQEEAHAGHVYGSDDAGRAEEAAAAQASSEEEAFHAAVEAIGQREGREEVREEARKAEREREEAKRQAHAARLQSPDKPVLGGATAREERAVKESLGHVVARERKFESAVQDEEERARAEREEEVKAVADERLNARQTQRERERRDQRAAEHEEEEMKGLQQQEAEDEDKSKLAGQEWPSAAS